MTDIEVLEREKQCVQRKSVTNCSDCAHCDLLMDDAVILTAYDHAISAFRQQEVTKKVEPLTLDELRQMDGEPVWVQSPGIPEYGRWAIVEGVGENCLLLRDDFTCHDYGKIWLAYRQKPEEGTV